MNASGRGFLIAGGVFYIVVGVLGFFSAIAINVLLAALPARALALLTVVPIELFVFYYFAMAVVYLVVGIAGIVYSNKPEHGRQLMVTMIVLVAFDIIMNAFVFRALIQWLDLGFFDYILGYAGAALYIIGAVKNMRTNLPIHTTPTAHLPVATSPVIPADELTKYADLLEKNLISREEFDNIKEGLLKQATNKPQQTSHVAVYTAFGDSDARISCANCGRSYWRHSAESCYSCGTRLDI